GAKDAAMLHLLTHAFFKAGLFLAAGAIIHTLHQAQMSTGETYDVQDIRNLGGLRKAMPVTFGVFLIGGASLSGIPMFSGFQSKEAILSGILAGGDAVGMAVAALFLIATFLTVTYTLRLIWFVFIAGRSGSASAGSCRRGPGGAVVMRFPTIVLALASLWWIVSLNPFSFAGWLTTGTASALTAVGSLGVVLGAVAFAYQVFRNRAERSR